MSIIVSDSTTIITLINIEELKLLKNIFKEVILPNEVYNEIEIKEYKALDSSYFIKKEIKNRDLFRLLNRSLDNGESEAIVLAKELNLSLIIDEKKGRKVAKNLNINIFGFLGLLILNYKKGFYSKNEIKAIFYKAKEQGFRVSKNLEDEFLELLKV